MGAGRNFLILGSVLAMLSVVLGAFGTHALRDKLTARAMEIFQTGIQYQSFHSLALILAAGLLYFRPDLRRLKGTCSLFSLGVLIFSGSLYTLSITGVKWLGAITPVGGACFLAGWVTLLVVAVSLPANPHP
ncbi:MAG: DUF423 domain-containing protein [Chlorobia bacterium]|nr:DUF423 domain-containing protein [Fimbriimonadaceae bacterium]